MSLGAILQGAIGLILNISLAPIRIQLEWAAVVSELSAKSGDSTTNPLSNYVSWLDLIEYLEVLFTHYNLIGPRATIDVWNVSDLPIANLQDIHRRLLAVFPLQPFRLGVQSYVVLLTPAPPFVFFSLTQVSILILPVGTWTVRVFRQPSQFQAILVSSSARLESLHSLRATAQHPLTSPRDISRFSPRIDWIIPGEALNPFFGAQDEGISEFRLHNCILVFWRWTSLFKALSHQSQEWGSYC